MRLRHLLPLMFLAATSQAAAQSTLPDLGSPSAQTLSEKEEFELGQQFSRELREKADLVTDPLLDYYINSLGLRVASAAPPQSYPFEFFLIDDAPVNAFAAPGGVIAIYRGLFMQTASEDELAAVIAHEVAHVSQRHIARGMADNKRSSLIGLASILAAMALSGSSGDAAAASLYTGVAAQAQHQINFTRQNEHEADRIGIGTLSRAGFDPDAMAGFFGKMQELDRYRSETQIEYLRTHPVNATRIAEARQRADQLRDPSRPTSSDLDYQLAKTRLWALSDGDTHRRPAAGGENASTVEAYGKALELLKKDQPEAARALLEEQLGQLPDNLWIRLALARSMDGAGDRQAALELLEETHQIFPDNQAATLRLARLHLDSQPGKAKALLKDALEKGALSPQSYRLLAEAAARTNDPTLSHEALASHFLARGQPYEALEELEKALKTTRPQSVSARRIESFRQRIQDIIAAQE